MGKAAPKRGFQRQVPFLFGKMEPIFIVPARVSRVVQQTGRGSKRHERRQLLAAILTGARVLPRLLQRRQALLALPRRRLQIYAATAVLLLAALTLIRWPLRVSGSDPILRPNGYTPVRVMVDGTVDRVAVREGSRVRQGDVLAVLRATSLAADRQGEPSRAVRERVTAILFQVASHP